MTNIEAIDLLDNLIGMLEDNHGSDYDTALKMAINSLKQEPCKNAVDKIKKASFTGSDGLDYVETLVALDALKISHSDYIPRHKAIELVKSYIDEIITESGVDKNEHTNRILNEIVGKLAFYYREEK